MAALLLVLSLIVLHEFYLLGRANEVIELSRCLLRCISPFLALSGRPDGTRVCPLLFLMLEAVTTDLISPSA